MEILVHPEFYPEKAYVIDVIFAEILRVDYKIQKDHRVKGYQILLPNGKRLVIEDHFWQHIKKDKTYLHDDYLPDTVLVSKNGNLKAAFGIPQIKRDRNTLVCRLDIFATAFLLLTAWEETISKHQDIYGRVPLTSTYVGRNQLYATPLIHEYATFIVEALRVLDFPISLNSRTFGYMPTHDIDYLTLWPNFWAKLKTVVGDVIKRQNLTYTRYLFGKARKLQQDPFHNFAYLNQVCHKYNVSSTYYFMSSGENYSITDPLLNSLIQGIKKEGHKIGFHPGIQAGKDKDTFQTELTLFKQHLDPDIQDVRTHYLSYRSPQTWRYWHDACLTRDSSFCYPDQAGFKTGMAQPFPLFDVEKREKLNIYEYPLIFMDRHLTKNNIPGDESINYIKNFVDQTRKYGGDFVFLWHNSSFHLPEWQPYSHVFESIFEL